MKTSKIVLAAFVWLIILAAGVSIWKLWIEPHNKTVGEIKRAEQDRRVLEATEGTSRFRIDVAIGLDSFSGYAILRSDEFRKQLADRGIRLRIVDDGADYLKRADSLAKNTVQFAAFPIDALIKTSTGSTLPSTIVAVIDESHGADALVAYTSKYPKVDALNALDTKFVVVGNSPSETIAQILLHEFDLGLLSKNSIDRVATPEKVVERYKKATPTTSEVFVLWEPYVSQILKNNGQLKSLIDSSSFSGYIVDSLVVNRSFLLSNPKEVDQVLESYFIALNHYRKPSDLDDGKLLRALLISDAKQNGLVLEDETAINNLVKGIQWKYTEDNYRYLGLSPGGSHLEEVIEKITHVLVSASAISKDPLDGKASKLYTDAPLSNLKATDFFPKDSRGSGQELRALNENEWKAIVPIGKLKTEELVFARGTDRLTDQSQSVLNELGGKLLHTWPNVYLSINGSASSQGDLEQNRILAAKRAQAALQYLQSLGVSAQRMRAGDGVVTGEAKVSFVIGQLPF